MRPSSLEQSSTADNRRRSKLVRIAAGASALLLVGGMFYSAAAGVLDPSTGTLDGVPDASPAGLGDIDLSQLQYGDPTENIALVDPPTASNDGSAALSLPLIVPTGRAGIQPDLSLSYNSDGGNGWAGVGWDLSVGSIDVDTTYGSPRYLSASESETYTLDGDRLFPNAIRTALQPRNTTGVKGDFVRQVETDYERIIRHGTTPSTYFWQVTDKKGTDRWYGGSPQGRDPSAVLTSPATMPDGLGGVSGDFHWALSYVEDISGNVMRFNYDKLTNVPIGRAPATGIGVSQYLRSITYTGSVAAAPAVDRAPYKVTFLRDDDVTGDDRRPDIEVDASSGIAVVTRDLLRGVEMSYYSETADLDKPGALIGGYRLEYDTNAPFDKSLLKRVGQYGKDGREHVAAWHDFDWYDEVTKKGGTYNGFAPPTQWDTEAAQRTKEVNLAATSALGSSERGGGDGGAYFGFNPSKASKNGSFGGSFNIAGGQSNELSMLIDLDGDGLPDKVSTDGGHVNWERNLSKPDTPAAQGKRFASPTPLGEIDSLGRARDIRVNLHFEAYPVVSIQVGGGFGFTIGERYFQDVNSDGRPDFIRPDKNNPPDQIVYFNVLDSAGVPRFVDSSLLTGVPLEAFKSDLAHAPVAEVADILRDSSPRIDTVRRWVAPFDGDVRVQGDPTLQLGADYRGDGARVMIEHNRARAFDRVLTKADPSASHDLKLKVKAGEAVYFRLHVIENGSNDLVDWAPVVSYVQGDGKTPIDAATDANGRSQAVYKAAEDFTLFGRTGARTAITAPGAATVRVTLTRAGALSDDVNVVLRHRTNTTNTIEVLKPKDGTSPVLPAGRAGATPGTVTLEYDLTIAPPGKGSNGSDDPDWVELDVLTDSPVDPNSFAVDVQLATTGGPSTEPKKINGFTIPGATAPVILPNVRVFGRSGQDTPFKPYAASDSGKVSLDVTLDGAPLRPQADDQKLPADQQVHSTAIITVKTANDGVIARSAPFTVRQRQSDDPLKGYRLTGNATMDFNVTKDKVYWVEVSVHEAAVGAAVALSSSATLKVGEARPTDENVPTLLQRPDASGVFAAGNRGWGLAGYNADHPGAAGAGLLNASQFVLSPPGVGDFNEKTPVPTAADAPDPAAIVAKPAANFPSALPYIAWSGFSGGRADRWRAAEKATLFGDGASMQSSRLGEEVAVTGTPPSDGRPAPEMLSVTGDFNFAAGLVASVSAAFGGGRKLRDYTDLNGDGFPDIRSGSGVEFTGPRGARALSTDIGDNTFDTTIAVSGGLSGSPINTTGAEKTTQSRAGSGTVGPTAKKTSRGLNLGLGFSISSQWSNPIPDGEADEQLRNLPAGSPTIKHEVSKSDGEPNATGTLIERGLFDINGDGLPDRVDTYSSGELWVNLGLGYRFAGKAVQWTTGRATATKNISGTLSAGFQINAYEFAGGVATTEGVGIGQFSWIDVDGDGVPDRVEQVTATTPRTVFGAGDGMRRREVTYGTYAEGEVAVDAANKLSEVKLGQQNAISRATGLSGGADLSFYIGPICGFGCYVVINPGAHGGYDRTTTQISMLDVNGDGYADVVKSTDDDDIEVSLNKRGRTNLLKATHNPLGGSIRLGYERKGNTVEQPESQWVMANVEVDDGRPGDGDSIQRSEYQYDGNVYDRLHRTTLGYAKVTEKQFDTTETHVYPAPGQDATELSETLIRSYERTYRNATPFDIGLMTDERLLSASGKELEHTSYDWDLVNAAPGADLGAPAPPLPAVGTAARVSLFDKALAPRIAADSLTRTDSQGDTQATSTRYDFDNFGNTIRVTAGNETETLADDTVTVMTYPDCRSPRTSPTIGNEATWVGVPGKVTVHQGTETGPVLRERDGSLDICANSVPIRIVEHQGTNACGDQAYAVTEMAFDAYGSYNAVRYPSNTVISPADCSKPPQVPPTGPKTFTGCDPTSTAEADRYCVDYVYDPLRFTDVALAKDNHGVSSSATYDPFTGRMKQRTDENGNLTEFDYDTLGRISTVTAPRELADRKPTDKEPLVTVKYSYGTPANGHAYAVARHYDRFNADGTPDHDYIDTATFVDGIGRVVQRKRDADVAGVPGPAVIVEGAVDFDAVGRQVKEWFPVVQKATAWPATGLPAYLTTYDTDTSSSPTASTNVRVTKPTEHVYDELDRVTKTTLPDQSIQETDYDIAAVPGSTPPLTAFAQTTKDPLKKKSRQYIDVRGLTLLREEFPADTSAAATGLLTQLPKPGLSTVGRIIASPGSGSAPITTRYDYDALGRLTKVLDSGGAATEHTYDLLDNRTSTTTPDSGRVTTWYTPAGQVGVVQDEVRRALGTMTTYRYDRDRLTNVDYPDATPDVTYTYGPAGAPPSDNIRGRVSRVQDGSMTRTYLYDVDGNVVTEAATRATNPFGKGDDPNPPAFRTSWTYDSLGRVGTLTYPEGEVLTTGYDRGGMPDRLSSTVPQADLIDPLGTVITRPPLSVTYASDVHYDEFQKPTFLRTGTGVQTSWAYEKDRRFLTTVDTDSTATTQFDGTTSAARPLQRLRYRYDPAGNVLDVANQLYDAGSATSLSTLGKPPENNVPGPSQHAYTYDGHYRITGAVARYVDRQEDRAYEYTADYARNGNLLSKRQVTTTTSTTGNKTTQPAGGNGQKKNDGTGVPPTGSTTTTNCDGNTGSGGGSFNQDAETSYSLGAADVAYEPTHPHQLAKAGTRTYSFDANGNLSGWRQPCSSSTLVRTLSWDAENRVTNISQGSNDTDYRYNAEGERTLERGPGGSTWFVNEHWRVENDGHRYANIYLGKTMLAMHRSEPVPTAPTPCDPCSPLPKPDLKINFLHADLQGSLRLATDERGGVFQYLDYLPTGQPWVAGQSRIRDTPYLFAGGWTDTTYKLVNFGRRWYEPREQQFYSPEPLLRDNPDAVIDDPSLLSAYTYAAANPLRYVDRDGAAPFDLGTNNEKHLQGQIRISDAKRAARSAPAITFGGRYSNDAAGQKLGESFTKYKDRADRFSTILKIETDRKRVRLFGYTLTKSPAPNPGPGSSGTDAAAPSTTPPAAPPPVAPPSAAPAPPPAAAGATNAGPGGQGVADGGADAAAAPPPAAGGPGSGNALKAPNDLPPLPPLPASAAAMGSDDDT